MGIIKNMNLKKKKVFKNTLKKLPLRFGLAHLDIRIINYLCDVSTWSSYKINYFSNIIYSASILWKN